MQLSRVVRAVLCVLRTVHNAEAGKISKLAYFERLHMLLRPCDSTWALALLFFELYAVQKELVVASIEPARLLATWGAAVVLALKWNEDHHYTNSTYAEIVGVTLAQLNELEHHFFGAVILQWHALMFEQVAENYERLRAHRCNLCPNPTPPPEAGPPRSVWRSVRRSVIAKVKPQCDPWRHNKLLSRVASRLLQRKCTALRKHRAARRGAPCGTAYASGRLHVRGNV